MGVEVTTSRHRGIDWTKMKGSHGRISISCDTHVAHRSDDGTGATSVTVMRRAAPGRPGRTIGVVENFKQAIDLIDEDKKTPDG